MHDLSYTLEHPAFDYRHQSLALYIYTFENVYGLDPDACAVRREGEALTVEARGLTWANGQEKAAGRARLVVRPSGHGDG